MTDSTLNELFGPPAATQKPQMARRRHSFTERNARFLDEMELQGCDPSTLVNMALNILIPKTYNHNFNIEELIKHARLVK